LSKVDELIEKLRKGEPIPSIEDMVKGKAWKTARAVLFYLLEKQTEKTCITIALQY
jgi:hypothetical protein